MNARSFLLAVAAVAVLPSGAALAAKLDLIEFRYPGPVEGSVAAGKEKAQVCNNCHGADGKAPVAMFPSVAGLPDQYLYWKLVEFKHSLRGDSIMTPLVANNTIEDLRDIAVFYASLPLVAPSPLTPEPVDAAVLDRGRSLYLHGDPAQGVPPCQGCHGVEGKGPTNAQPFQMAWPPLYGQQATYMTTRLNNFRTGYAIDTTMDKIMQGVVRNMTAEDIDAVAAYVERLDGR